MKKITATYLLAAAAALLSLASPATAGMLTVLDGLNFTPESSFTNNTIDFEHTVGQGALIHILGSATVAPGDSNQATVDLSGTFSAEAGDFFSGAYSFSADLNIDTPVGYTISGMATILGVPVEFMASGTIDPGLHRYEGTFAAPGPFPIADAGNFSGTLTLDFGSTGGPSAAEPGTLDLAIQQIDFKLDPIAATVAGPSVSQNISTRADVGVDEHVLIAGFIVTGMQQKTVVLRGIGPSLSAQDVNGVLADPVIDLHDATGATIATNDNWMDLSADDQMTLSDHDLTPAEDAESALVMTLDPGQYTVVLRGANESTGVGLVEAYDIDGGTTVSQFGNISTRGFVETGENQMIGGFILGGGGGGSATVLVRAIGPSLTNNGIADPLADPFLELHDSNGNVVDSNDNWMDDPNMQQVSDSGLAPDDPNESALYKILPAGGYTAIVSGVGDTTGVALVESYNLDVMPASGTSK